MLATELWNITSMLSGVLILQTLTGCLAVTCPSHVADRRHSHTAVFQGTCYLFVNRERYWDTAKADCMNLGGEMLIVKDDETMNFIRDQLNSKELSWDREGIWLGARYDGRYWRWTDGTKLSYTHWAPGEPSKFFGFYSPCAQMRADDNWKWHNKPCGSVAFHYNYICQFPIAVQKKSNERPKEQDKSEEVKSEEKTNSSNEGRVSSEASNQEKDNGNTTILIIVLSLTVGFLIITLLIFLIIRRHYLMMRRKNESNEVYYQNGASGIGMAVRRDPEDQPPAVPTSRPPPMNDLYLTPQEVTEPSYTQVNRPKNVSQSMNVQRSNLYPNVPEEPVNLVTTNNGQIGACGGSDVDFEMKLPLINNSARSEENSLPRNGPTESCACHGSSGTDEYVDMRSMASLSDNGKLKPDEDKHTYCNTHPRESTANENLYESLP